MAFKPFVFQRKKTAVKEGVGNNSVICGASEQNLLFLKFVYIEMKMWDLSIYPRKTEFLCLCIRRNSVYVGNNVYTLSNCISLRPQRI